MPVDARSSRLLRVVDVDRVEVSEADGSLEIIQGLRVTFRRDEIVTGGVHVAGVEAHPQPPPSAGCRENVAQMLEAVTDRRSLAGGRLEQDPDAPGAGASEGFIERRRDASDAGRFAFSAVRARVQDEIADAQTLAAADLIGESRDRLPPQRLEGRSEVDQIRGVGGDVSEGRSSGRAAEVPDFGRGDLLADPTAVVLDEDLEHPAARREPTFNGERRPAGDGLMCP
jgi:hypothetical protein